MPFVVLCRHCFSVFIARLFSLLLIIFIIVDVYKFCGRVVMCLSLSHTQPTNFNSTRLEIISFHFCGVCCCCYDDYFSFCFLCSLCAYDIDSNNREIFFVHTRTHTHTCVCGACLILCVCVFICCIFGVLKKWHFMCDQQQQQTATSTISNCDYMCVSSLTVRTSRRTEQFAFAFSLFGIFLTFLLHILFCLWHSTRVCMSMMYCVVLSSFHSVFFFTILINFGYHH